MSVVKSMFAFVLRVDPLAPSGDNLPFSNTDVGLHVNSSPLISGQLVIREGIKSKLTLVTVHPFGQSAEGSELVPCWFY